MARDSLPHLFPTLKVTDACNKRCSACLRSPELARPALRRDDVARYLRDLERLSQRYLVKHQFVTGGEPTLWRDGPLEIVDLLAEISARGCVASVTMPTNGLIFERPQAATDFVARLSARLERRVLVGLSVASFQQNLDERGCAALENLLAAARLPGAKVLPFLLVTLGSADDTSERLARRYPAVPQRVTALAPLGRASSLGAECPSLPLASSDKASLGAFGPHFRKDVLEKLELPAAEYEAASNAELLNRLSLFNNCGRSPFVDDRWHYCLPMLDDPDFDLGALGELEPESLERFVEQRPWLRELREHGVVAAARRNLGRLSPGTREHVEQLLGGERAVAVAYRGCMLCRRLHELGVWRELQAWRPRDAAR